MNEASRTMCRRPQSLLLLAFFLVDGVIATEFQLGSLRGGSRYDDLPRVSGAGARLGRWSSYMPSPPRKGSSKSKKRGKRSKKSVKAQEALAVQGLHDLLRADALTKRPDKGTEEKIVRLRLKLCWNKPKLEEHESCMKFMGNKCSKGRLDISICQKFTLFVTDSCEKSGVATSNEKHMRKVRCDVAKQVNPNVVEPEEPAPPPEKTSEKTSEPPESNQPRSLALAPAAQQADSPALATPSSPAPAPAPAPDSDGDGVPDDVDIFPKDAKEQKDSDEDGHGDHGDVFPHEPTEWSDSDNDGVGDNTDMYPHDPRCKTDPCLLPDGSLAPAAAPAAPTVIDMSKRPLPVQGFDEHSEGKFVDHNDGKTWTGDWKSDWLTDYGDDFGYPSENEERVRSICEFHPDNEWCSEWYNKNGRWSDAADN